ncbi:TPA: hypothetical protein ACOQ44_005428 [Bacillus cereus]|nr:hypothetical protein [Bacillus cereus]
MTRKVSNLFPNSATRDNDKEEKTKSKQQQNENININVNDNEIPTKQEQDEIPKETPENNNVNEEEPEEPGKKDSDETEEEDDVLAFLNETNKKVLVGFYLDEDINKVIKKLLGKKPGRGTQSQLANNIFRKFFEEKGLL